MNVIACTTSALPCPLADQVLVSLADALDLASVGLGSAGMTQAYLWGLGTVLTLWAIGWLTGVIVGVIRRA